MIDIKNELKGNKTILLVIPSTTYNEAVLDVVKQVSEADRICYISMNKTLKSLRESFGKNNINDDKFFYIDCITKTMRNVEDEENCIFCHSPNDLTEIGLAVSKAQARKPNIIIFDSLSTLLVYHDDLIATKFAQSLINKIRESGMCGIFTILEKDKDATMSKNMGMMMDKVLIVD